MLMIVLDFNKSGIGQVKIMYSGISILWSPTRLDKSDLNGEVTILQGLTSYSFHSVIQFGIDQG